MTRLCPRCRGFWTCYVCEASRCFCEPHCACEAEIAAYVEEACHRLFWLDLDLEVELPPKTAELGDFLRIPVEHTDFWKGYCK